MSANLIWKFIDDQPQMMLEILAKEVKNDTVVKKLKPFESVVITASGSSLNSALICEYLLRDAGISVRVIDPFDLRLSGTLFLGSKTLLVALSQTGRSVGTLESIRLVNELGGQSLAMTADAQSPIADAAHHHIDILCGDEPVGPKTKGVVAMTLMLHLFMMRLLGDATLLESYKENYKAASLNIMDTVEKTKEWCSNNKRWHQVPHMSITGYGVNNASAREASLKILETMQIPIMNYNLEEYMHGPHRTIVEGTPLIVFHSQGIGSELAKNLIAFASEKTKNLLVVSDSGLNYSNTIQLKKHDVSVSWVNFVVVSQVICSFLPELNGVNPSDPVYGTFAKTVGTRI